ncbi:UDP-N-acetylglucosamine 2-epimerase [uncultured Eubacterium sp.]|nr:UDP-N-acetylglucosamine 2-epimerase [uncultured Eubacterium sp.]
MKIVTIVGARPQFIKAAVLSRIFEKDSSFDEVIIHTGQHYDSNMSDVFFQELAIPKPKYNLGISGGSHGKMTGEMIICIEEIVLKEKPDMILLYGDTNSTLAGAIATSKLNIPIAHVEAGGRLGTMSNPEEINRIITDHVSSTLFACTASAMDFLKKEGLLEKAYLVGDPMYDAFRYYSGNVGDNCPEKLIKLDGTLITCPNEFYYLTCHRQENTDIEEKQLNILDAMESLDKPCVYPVHPRNSGKVKEICSSRDYMNVMFVQPVGYLMSIYLTKHAEKIITDSGGLQREAYFAKKQCVTVFDYVAWPETMVKNRNQLAKPMKSDILNKLSRNVTFDDYDMPFGDSHAAEKIIAILKERYLR